MVTKPPDFTRCYKKNNMTYIKKKKSPRLLRQALFKQAFTLVLITVSIFRRLSLELDMLLNNLPPPSSYSTHTLPAKLPQAHKVPIGLLQAEEKALEGQVSSLTNKRDQLAGELEGLISQVSTCCYWYIMVVTF